MEIESGLYWPYKDLKTSGSIVNWSSITKYNFSKILESNKINFSIKKNNGEIKKDIDEFIVKKEISSFEGEYNYFDISSLETARNRIAKKIFKIIDSLSKNHYNQPGFFENEILFKEYLNNRLEDIFSYKAGIESIKPIQSKNRKAVKYAGIFDVKENKLIKSCSMYTKYLNKRDIFGFGNYEHNDKNVICPFELLSHEELKTDSPFQNEKYVECKSLTELIRVIKKHFKSIDKTDKKLIQYISYQLIVYIELFLINFELFKKSIKNEGNNKEEEKKTTFSKIIDNRINICWHSIDRALNRIRFSPPLREKPKKYQSRSELNEIYSLSPEADFNYWNKALKEIGFNYEIFIEEISESHDLYAIKLKDKASGIESYLDEVGYGFSQFLPYLGWKFNYQYYDLKIYEQPELHLHPSAQAKLPEVLIKNFSKNAGKKIKIDGPDLEYWVMDDFNITTEYGESSDTVSKSIMD